MGDVIEILTTATNTVEVEAQGPQGIPGVGVPTGGSALQVLRKKTGTDYDTEWAAAGSGSGSVTSVALASTDLTISGSPITDSGTITANLGNTGVTAGTYTKVTVDAKGRVTTGATATASDVGAAPATGIDPTAISGTAVVDSDPRLSDARTPSSTLAHSSSHHTGGTDAIAPNEISAAWALETRQHSFFSTSTYTLAQGRNVQLNVSIPASGATGTITLPRLTTDLAQNGDDVFVVLSGTIDGGQTLVIERYIWTGSSYDASKETIVTTTTAGAWKFRLIGAVWTLLPVQAHTHGNITNGGLVGTTANLPLKTGTGGIVEAGAFGTGAGEFAEGNHTHADLHTRSHAITSTSDHTAGNHKVFYSNGSGEIVELALGNSGEVLTSNGATSAPSFAAASGGGVTGAAASASDVLGVSGSDITGVDATADRIVFWDDSASKLAYLEAGSGLSISGTTLSATASGGTKTYATFTATDNQPPASNYATLDTRNSIAVLDFDDATDESAVFVSIIPEGASLGSGLKIRLHWMATTATSGNVVWDVSLERMTTDLDSDSFDTIASGTAAANGTSGILTVTEITMTTIDSVTAGDGYRLKVTRDANNASDTMTGDAELVVCEVRSAA